MSLHRYFEPIFLQVALRQISPLDLMPDIKEILDTVLAFTNFVCPIVLEIDNEKNTAITGNERSQCKQLLIWASMEILAIPLVSMNLSAKGVQVRITYLYINHECELVAFLNLRANNLILHFNNIIIVF